MPAYFRYRVRGRENVGAGNHIVVANHIAWFDTVLVAAALPSRPALHTMARRDTVFNTRLKRWLMPRLCVFPVTTGGGHLDEAAVQHALRVLAAGGNVLIFPEGSYSRAGRLRPFKSGVGHLALQSGRPILPVAVVGPSTVRFRGRVEVVIGRPFRPRRPLRQAVRERAESIAAGLRRRIAGLREGAGPSSHTPASAARSPPVISERPGRSRS